MAKYYCPGKDCFLSFLGLNLAEWIKKTHKNTHFFSCLPC